eukprot:SAG11_NODE_2194_length_3702_cov_1.574799_4_plen_58_part_00
MTELWQILQFVLMLHMIAARSLSWWSGDADGPTSCEPATRLVAALFATQDIEPDVPS